MEGAGNEQGKLPINSKYQPDPDLKKGLRAELDDYKNSTKSKPSPS